MEEKNGLDILLQHLTEWGFSPDVSVVKKGSILSRKTQFASDTTVTVLLSDSIYFVARSNVSSSFMGIYSSIQLPVDAEYKVYKKDKFDFLFLSKRQKVGIKYIDENLTIISSKWIPSKELNSENTALFLDINKTGIPYKLVIENNYLFSIVEPLIDKKIIGIETENWLCQKEELENLLKKGENLIRKMKETYAQQS